MKRVVCVFIFVLGLCLILSCDSEKDQYSGLSGMVADRQEVRKNIAKDNQHKKSLEEIWQGDNSSSDPASDPGGEKREPISPVVVYEKQIEIWDSDSKRQLAKGVAFMNKSGQIVKIKVYRK